MTITDWTGAIGVTILLIAYFFNLTNKITNDSLIYLVLNLIGAAISCIASILLKYFPFIILEGCWTLVSAIGIIKYLINKEPYYFSDEIGSRKTICTTASIFNGP